MKLQELLAHFFVLYGKRNNIFLSGFRTRIDFLNLAIGDLQQALRDKKDKEILAVALARITARIFCVLHNFVDLPFIEALAQKYPKYNCSYCGQLPCQCPEQRQNPQMDRMPLESQLEWSLKEWCTHLAKIYGERNKLKGIDNLLNRLFKEVTELESLAMQIPFLEHQLALDEIELEIAYEIADALAWTIAVANFLQIDLEAILIGRYGKVCWNCKCNPCCCTGFNIKPVKW